MWHAAVRAGKPARRPRGAAYDAAVLIPEAPGGGRISRQTPGARRRPSRRAFRSHLNIDFIKKVLAPPFPDRELVSFFEHGASLKAELLEPMITILPNLLSFNADGDHADALVEEVHSLVERGWIESIDSDFPPFFPWRCSPRGSVARTDGGAPRIVNDNSAPHLRSLPKKSASMTDPPRPSRPRSTPKLLASGADGENSLTAPPPPLPAAPARHRRAAEQPERHRSGRAAARALG